jgi:hypothetical protein
MSSMMTTVNIQLPERTYRRLQRAAEMTHRSVEDVLASTVEAALPTFVQVPEPLASDLAAMDMFNDDALWAAAESALSRAQQRRLNQLSHAGGQRPLTSAETAELAQLIDQRDQAVLRRSRALALLAYRGYEVPAQSATTKTIHDGVEDF